MSDFVIVLKPTNEKITLFGDKEFRIFRGRTNTGIDLEMLGLFRINDPVKRAEFENTVCAVAPGDPPVVKLVTEEGLVRP